MSISNLYSSGQHKMNLSHFANIVKIAKIDNLITDEEKQLLNKVAKRLNINEIDFEKILKSPDSYPIKSPVSYDERIERLYHLAKMILADGKADLEEVKLMRKIAVGLSFKKDNVEKVCDEAIHLVIKDNDLDDFIAAIKNVDSI